jgi:hypothetical protein
MRLYVCILIGEHRKISAVTAFRAGDDAEAHVRAIAIASENNGTTEYQLWQDGRRVLQQTGAETTN